MGEIWGRYKGGHEEEHEHLVRARVRVKVRVGPLQAGAGPGRSPVEGAAGRAESPSYVDDQA